MSTHAAPSVSCDALVIGAGFFGAMIALELRALGLEKVILAEAADAVMRRASLANQARIHNGYHYPRSLLTGASSCANYRRFCEEFSYAVLPRMDAYYAIARNSKVSPSQFERFCARIGAPIHVAPASIRRLFDSALIAEIYEVDEAPFDARRIASSLRQKLHNQGIDCRFNTRATVTGANPQRVTLRLNGEKIEAAYAFNATYAAIDQLNVAVRTPIKREWAEVAMVRMPPHLAGKGVTVMDGAFFSTLPFPARGCHSLTHVRYTPLASWQRHEPPPTNGFAAGFGPSINAISMQRDAARYVPALRHAQVLGSLFEIKAMPAASESTDGRPILFEIAAESPRLVSVLGGKIDHVYDVLARVRQFFGAAT
jgi:glycine/D-amino acid oxidase-like deaminating enzyme